MNFRHLIIVMFGMLLASCSLNTDHPVFLPYEGDYIGQKMPIKGLKDQGKPTTGYLEVNPNSDGSYIARSNMPPKYDDRYVFKAIQRIDDGVIFAVQMDMEPRPLWNLENSRRSYEIYPVKISNSGEIIIYEFITGSKVSGLAKKYKIRLEGESSSIRIRGNFQPLAVQCFVQDLIRGGYYRPLAKDKKEKISLVGYKQPDKAGISECSDLH